MNRERPYSKAIARLREAGLRPTRQRLALAKLLFESGNRHISAELLHGEARRAGIRVSLATVYNTLHQFTAAGLMNEIVVDPTRSYFDTNTAEHHHFYFVETGRLEDIPDGGVGPMELPEPPPGTTIKRVDVVIRLDGNDS
ncbi:MAG: Fur family transcriptional regulator [Rhodospirillales bacterium]|jgi:Fur family iron response transcriptional regulator|nr:Fur family transcriptional regulator [Rhodospirillales bacterium]MDP6805524.1 Fur family transcriptional regulator [Rhodospirillales bacterium]